ncbi:hypothetical protein MFLAVUS_008296, partial [Mucor flavus]
MLAASATLKPSSDARNKYQAAFDTFDSPFHTPSLFGKSNMFKKHEPHNYDAFYSSNKDNFQLFNQPNEPLHSIMPSWDSSDTHPLKNDSDMFNVEHPPFLYHKYQRKPDPSPVFSYNYNQKEQSVYPESTFEYQSLNENAILNYIDRLSNDAVRQQLKESIDYIQQLSFQVDLLNVEAEKAMFTNVQTSLANKDLEFRQQDQKLSLATQYCDTQTKKLNSMQAELAMYQSLIQSKGLELPAISGEMAVTMESSENKPNRLRKMRDYPETSKSMETPSDIRNNEVDIYFNTGRRWSEEKTLTQTHSINATIIDKNVNASWDSLVDRIINETDQKASLYLQNKFKCSTLDQKRAIFKSILNKAYDLMTNRFGNFLIQKLLELGSEDQVQALVNTMKGRILVLTCEPFGCHVVQKVLDHVSEPVKAELISELFVKIPETITHKYACHVWQKVFEVRWSTDTTPMMNHIHESLKGRWAQIALDETGSLVIQNIFENLTEEDKRPVLDEVLQSTAMIAKGQWGNWVIQHILEQAEKSSDRETAYQTVIKEAVQLSMDQFASKVVEKALRIGGEQFTTKFIKRISTVSCSHRPRMALVDIASDQYGNYVVQWLINNASEEQKISTCRLIKRHMVSLRGSKYGQRVAFLVEKVLRNVELTTYPTS